MRTPGLQRLYLQKPLVLILLIAAISVLPWIGMGDYYTKGEPREASVAVSMLEEGNWVLPRVYADEFAYKPPFTHWIIALFSLPEGEVTPFTSRLPSALAFIFMVGCCFIFFAKHLKGHKSFIACLILITCFELHRAAMTSRVDMVLTALIVVGLIKLYQWWDDKQLKGLPWYLPVLLGCAALVKGPVGIILPLLVFGIYLLLIKFNFWKIVWKLGLLALISIIPLLIWYYLAYKQGGDAFLDVVWAENFGRFLSSDNLEIRYNLGHEEPVWYNFITLIAGFIPWTLMLLFSLFGLKYSLRIPGIKTLWKNFLSMDKIKLFSIVASVIIFVFYCIPEGKRSVYLMPVYPFIAIFLSQYLIYIAEYHPKVNRFFAVFSASLIGLISVICVFTLLQVIHIQDIMTSLAVKGKTLYDSGLIGEALAKPTFIYIILLFALLYSVFVVFDYLRKKNNLKLLYTVFGLYFTMNLLLDGTILPAFKDGTSLKPFITEIKEKYPLTENNVYVMNDLLVYTNLYGPNFYMHNSLQNFEKVLPKDGFFLAASSTIERMKSKYGDQYKFTLLEETPNRYNEVREVVQLYKIN